MSKILGFFGFSLHQFAVTAAVVAMAFFAGAAWQNGHATKTAVDAVQRDAAAREVALMAAVQRSVSAYKKAEGERLSKERKAEEISHNDLTARLAAAESAYRRAMVKLAKQREHPDASYPSDTLIVGGADLRRLLNDGAGACPGSGALPAAAELYAGADDRAAVCAAAADVRLGDLKAGILVLSKWGDDIRSQLLATQTHARALGLAPAAIPASSDK